MYNLHLEVCSCLIFVYCASCGAEACDCKCDRLWVRSHSRNWALEALSSASQSAMPQDYLENRERKCLNGKEVS